MNKRRLLSIERNKYEVEKDGEYEYIKTYFKDDILPNGKIVGRYPYMKIKHLYCGSIYEIKVTNFINDKQRCGKCCHTYDNSFAYHIEKELGEPLEKYWDFEKNTVNPRCIAKNLNAKNSKGENLKVWIKCQETDYHGSYEISCGNFVKGNRCSYCNSNNKNSIVHPLDSFGQYLKNNDLFHLWSDKNTIDPFKLSKSNHEKVWILCDKVNYHNDNGGYEIRCIDFSRGYRCGYCKKYKVHPLDSFGTKYPDKAKCWHEDNDKSPYEVAPNARNKYKFRCYECGHVWDMALYAGSWCPNCSKSKGEDMVEEFLKNNNITYEPQKRFDDLRGIGNGLLSYDFYLIDYNLLIEYQGEFHDGTAEIQTDEGFKYQQEHDRRKKQYAMDNNIDLLEIWYYDFDNIESILEKQLKL